MFFAHEFLKAAVAAAVHSQLKSLGDEMGQEIAAAQSVDSVAKLLNIPPQFEMGQLAIPCFPFAKTLRMPPQAVAEKLADKLSLEPLPLVEKIEGAGGFLNFFADFSQLSKLFLPRVLDESLFAEPLIPPGKHDKVVVEYSQPNTHKALHIGHVRCLVLGDAVSRILAGAQHEVVKVTYPGDMGAHIAKTLWYLKTQYKGTIPESHRGDWLGDLYADAHDCVESAKSDEQRSAEIKSEIGRILAELQSGSGPYFDLWKETREWSFQEMRDVYEWMNVHFDQWYTESECDAPSRDLVKQKQKEGLFVLDQGAIGIDLKEHKLGFALLLKSDGNGLYLTKDLELIRRKFADPEVTRSVTVVDARQKLHFKQVFKIAELMGYPQAKASIHLAYETVNTADGKKAFSSRSKNGVKLSQLRTEMENKVKTDYLERYRNDWTEDEINKTAKIVTVGAIKYGMLKVDNNTQVNFDLSEWLKLDGDTGPYLQYVHARCLNILQKQGGEEGLANCGRLIPNPVELTTEIEKILLNHLVRYFDSVKTAADQLRPAVLCTYLYELAKIFNRFYEQCSIKESQGPTRQVRLALVRSVANTMRRGLDLLGIEAPDRM